MYNGVGMFDKAIITITLKRFDINNKSSRRHVNAKKHSPRDSQKHMD